MKQSLRRLICAVLVLALLATGAYALSSGDSLISLSYLTSVFFPEAVKQGDEAANSLLQERYNGAKQDLDQVQKDLIAQATGGEGGLYSLTLFDRDWSDGDMITLTTGSGFKMGEGTAVVTHRGVVVDVTEGTEVSSGARLAANHRYLVGEDTTAEIMILSGAATLGVQGGYAYTEGKKAPTPFYDVSQTDWYYSAVEFVYENGLFSGTGEHTFSPGTAMNRAMVMTVFYQLAGAPAGELASAQIRFSDVPESAWYASYVKWAAVQQITAGTGPDTFSPEQKINREQMVTLLYSFATKYLGLTLDTRADLSGYTDLNQASDWARDALSWAVSQGILGSTSPDALVLSPKKDANRAEVAAMLRVFSEKIL